MGVRPGEAELHGVRPGQQDRSRRTQEALLAAAAALVAERGLEGTTIADIAARADASVGAVYHHFRDKKAITHALFDRYCEMMAATTAEAVDPARWQGASVRDILQGHLRFVLRDGDEASSFGRAGHHLVQTDQSMRDRFAQMWLDLAAGLSKLMLDRADEIGHPEPEFAVAFVLDQVSSMLRSRVIQPVAPTLLDGLDDESWMQAVLASAEGFLQLRR